MEKPILFSGEMVRAILDGRKTQTRRVVKQKHIPFVENILNGFLDGKWNQRPAPYGKPGDTLWVRETWAEFPEGRIIYRATDLHQPIKWRPSIFMPRWASRLTLRVVNVRVKRVQEIDDAGAIAEGIRVTESADFTGLTTGQPVKDFMMLWDSINAKRGYSWDSNPWVWVVEFEVVK